MVASGAGASRKSLASKIKFQFFIQKRHVSSIPNFKKKRNFQDDFYRKFVSHEEGPSQFGLC